MNHNEAVRENATEKYLLNELDPAVRDQFEEHLFDCQECALDLRTAATFVEQSKVILSEGPPISPVRVSVSAPANSGWFAWLRPAFAVPVLALLLAIIGYQSLTYSQLQRAANSPRVLASAVVNVGIRGGTITEVPAHPGEAFQLSINVPPDGRYTSYKLDLYSPQGAVEWSRTIPASGDGTLSIYIPGSDHEPGGLGVHGIAADGESVDLGRYPLELQNQK